MRAVFLDAETFSPEVELTPPEGVTDWQKYPATEETPEAIIARLKAADIAIVNKMVLDKAILEQLPQLKLVQISATGMDNVDLAAAKALGITVKNVAGYSVNSVSEHALMLLLSVMRAGIAYNQKVNDGTWTASGQFCLNEPPIFDLDGKTLGIIGVGAIAKNMTRMAEAIGMKVLWAEHQGKVPRDARYTAFDEVLAQSDVISLHCPLTAETEHLINKETIAKMTKHPVLINCARGAVINAADVADALKTGALLGLGCDVFDMEPPPLNHPLLQFKQHPRVILSPHNAWVSLSAQRKLWSILRAQVTAFISENQ